MRYVIITGEVSGDRIGAELVSSLKELDSNGQFFALGGKQLHKQGVKIIRDIDDISIMGFSNPLIKILRFWRLFTQVKTEIKSINPDVIIYIDFAGFNLRLGNWTKTKGYTNIYIAPPKTWASRANRNRNLQKNFDLIFTLFPFAKEYFHRKKVNTEFYGHPIMESFIERGTQQKIKKILIVPGSRIQEIRAVMPIVWKFIETEERYEFIVSKMAHIYSSDYSGSESTSANVRFSEEPLSDLLGQADFAIITSGTATLEAAMIGIPQVIIYKTTWFNYLVAKKLITTKYIGLPNLILNSRVIPELIQDDLTPENLSIAMNEVVNNIEHIKSKYSDIRAIYINKNSASRMAERIISHMKSI